MVCLVGAERVGSDTNDQLELASFRTQDVIVDNSIIIPMYLRLEQDTTRPGLFFKLGSVDDRTFTRHSSASKDNEH